MQLAAVIIICRIFTLMTYIPLIENGHSLKVQLSAAAVSSLIQAVMLIPSVMLFRDGNDTEKNSGICERVLEKSRFWGYIVISVYYVYFILAAAYSALNFTEFIGSRFIGDIPEQITLLLLILVCLYCTRCGIEGIGRAAPVVIAGFIIMLIVMLCGGLERIDTENIAGGFDTDSFLRALYNDLSRSFELTILCFGGKYISQGFRKSAYYSLAARLLCTVITVLGAVLVLGDYVYMCSYPFLNIGSTAGVRFLQRIDSVYMIIWVLASVTALSAALYTASDVLKTAAPSLNRDTTALVSALLLFIAALPYAVSDKDAELYKALTSLPALLVTAVLIPLIILITSRKGKNNENK